MERRLFTPEDKIAPGLYMKYWDKISEKHRPDELSISNPLKPYAEVRSGAILAALWTKATGDQYFVSFPKDEPADVEIYSLVPTTFKGVASTVLERIQVQLTRCSLASGETVSGQIMKKNKQSLENITLVVHIIPRDGDTLDLDPIVEEVRRINPLYPAEIALIAPLASPKGSAQVFGQFLITSRDDPYVRRSQVSVDDAEAFFESPGVLRSRKGTGQAIEVGGKFSLILP